MTDGHNTEAIPMCITLNKKDCIWDFFDVGMLPDCKNAKGFDAVLMLSFLWEYVFSFIDIYIYPYIYTYQSIYTDDRYIDITSISYIII